MQPQYISLPAQAKNITGKRFGRLVALGPVSQDDSRNYVWHCRCDCGREKNIGGHDLRSGGTQSCGCLRWKMRDRDSICPPRIVALWRAIKDRCFNPRNPSFAHYGGRGISLFDQWLYDLEAFCDYVSRLENFGDPGRSLDRINNNEDYAPDNLRWATTKQQSLNRSSNLVITIDNVSHTASEWAEIYGVHRNTIYSRIRVGWSPRDAVLTPPRRIHKSSR